MKNLVLIIVAAVVTVLLLIFPSQIFELGYYNNEFSNEMYNEHLYFTVAIITALFAWGGAALFYYVINSVRFSRWYHWLLTLAVVSLFSAVVNYIYPNSLFTDMGFDYSAQLFSFCVFDFLVTAVLFILASFAIRWWSSNCRHTPFPE